MALCSWPFRFLVLILKRLNTHPYKSGKLRRSRRLHCAWPLCVCTDEPRRMGAGSVSGRLLARLSPHFTTIHPWGMAIRAPRTGFARCRAAAADVAGVEYDF